jgi:tetratricopeptide (TPR) repeat protein
MIAFRDADAAGWPERACTDVPQEFERLEEAHGAQAAYMAGLSHHRCDHLDRAASAYRASLAQGLDNCLVRTALGAALLDAHDLQGAETAFREAIRGDPRCIDGYSLLGTVLRRRGNDHLEEALSALRRALALDSHNLGALNELALVHFAQSTDDITYLERAALVCRQAHAIDETHAPTLNTWGLVLSNQGDIVEALRRFEQARRADPEMYEPHMNFGQITLAFRGYEDAQTAFRDALGVRPYDYDAHIGLGVALRGLGRIEEARTQYDYALALDPERAEAWFNLGVLLQDFGQGNAQDLRRALAFFETFLTKARQDPQFATRIEEVGRRCGEPPSRQDCSPGRLEVIEASLRLLEHRPPARPNGV